MISLSIPILPFRIFLDVGFQFPHQLSKNQQFGVREILCRFSFPFDAELLQDTIPDHKNLVRQIAGFADEVIED